MKNSIGLYKKIACCVLLAVACRYAGAQTKVILKLDDIGANKNTCKALPVMEYLLQRGVKASYGVIANRLDSTAGRLLYRYINARDAQGNAMVEIWHHGLDHSRNETAFEFKSAPYAEQHLHFDSADRLVKKYLGVQMHTFGAPYNATDSVCLRVVSENPQYQGIFFSRAAMPPGAALTRLNNQVGMEKTTGKPDAAYFIEQYEKHPEYRSSYLVLQGHPPYWDEASLAEFKKILDFLDARQCDYVLPAELYTAGNKK